MLEVEATPAFKEWVEKLEENSGEVEMIADAFNFIRYFFADSDEVHTLVVKLEDELPITMLYEEGLPIRLGTKGVPKEGCGGDRVCTYVYTYIQKLK